MRGGTGSAAPGRSAVRQPDRAECLLAAVTPALLAALIVAFWSRALLPLADIDLWWHLSMGAWISEQRALPVVDPLGVWQDASALSAQIVLRGQWLGQVALNAAWQLGGLSGVSALRATLMALALLGVAAIGRLRGERGTLHLALLAVGALGFLEFAGERPQLFSFVFAVLLWAAIEWIRASERPLSWLLPPVMTAVWVQFHGAAFLAPLLCMVAAVGCRLEAHFARKPGRSGRLFLAALACFAALAFGPNGLATYQYIFEAFVAKSADMQALSEYSRPWVLGLFATAAWVYWALLALSVPCLALLLARRAWHDALALLFFAVFSLLAWRNVAFFLLLAPPLLARACGELFAAQRGFERLRAWAALPIVAAWIAYAAWQPPNLRPEIAAGRFPVALMEQVTAAGLRGRAFTALAWGGYVGWASRGRIVPFIDGRLLEAARLEPYKHMLWATPDGLKLFEAAGFDLAIVPHHGNFSNEPYPLPRALLARGGWVQVASDPVGVLLVRVGY